MTNLDSYYFISNKRPRRNQLHSEEIEEIFSSSKINIYFKTFVKPLISKNTGCPCEAISVIPNHPCTIGRKKSFCEYIFSDRRVSKRHCQILYDSILRKIFIRDGGSYSFVRGAYSLNGVFVNGDRIKKGTLVELSMGDEVLFVCPQSEGNCRLGMKIGFVIEKIELLIEESVHFNDCTLLSEKQSTKCDEYIKRSKILLGQCRQILNSDEPIACLQHLDISAELCQIENKVTPEFDLFELPNVKDQFEIVVASDGALNSVLKENVFLPDVAVKEISRGISFSPPGKKFYLNSLKSVDHGSLVQHPVISLRDLVDPVESLTGIFIATFTSDILWFTSYCDIPSHLPVTIACHNTERCWSSSLEKRSSVPYSDFPTLVVVNPLFPEAIAFGNDRKKQGIACHHPKLFVLLREDRIRVVITSANLVEKQWNSITNTVWWQDFPRACSPNHLSLFSYLSHKQTDQDADSDFAAQLAGFMASLVFDVPNQAHWILNLAKYNFKGAVGHLVASIPGLHSYRTPRMSEYMHLVHARSSVVNFLGSVEASVVGLSHLFRTSADSNGGHLRTLASFLGKCRQNAYGMSEVVLKRNTHISVDVNAVSVLVPNPDESFKGDCIQLGFLPRNIAKWVSPLWDGGFFKFSGHIYPREALSAALEENNRKIQITLYVSQGPNFSDMTNLMQSEHVSALCSLVSSVQRCLGLWRLEEVLGRFKWPELLETDFFYGASSIGSAVNPPFMAAFSASVGKRSFQSSDSQESDPEWGCWDTNQESKRPSIKIIFPTINRVQNASCGIWPSKRILCFAERTWLKLRDKNILHDAIPHPYERIGHPMHVKVAQRRFKAKQDATSFGWVYNGSHNFSAAAWGRPILTSTGPKPTEKNSSSKSLKLHICNYELGIIFIFPPSKENVSINIHDDDENYTKMDDIVFPFVVPAPRYGYGDKPATKYAMREKIEKRNEVEIETIAEEEVMEEDIVNEEDEVVMEMNYGLQEEEEKAYADTLWTQVGSSS